MNTKDAKDAIKLEKEGAEIKKRIDELDTESTKYSNLKKKLDDVGIKI